MWISRWFRSSFRTTIEIVISSKLFVKRWISNLLITTFKHVIFIPHYFTLVYSLINLTRVQVKIGKLIYLSRDLFIVLQYWIKCLEIDLFLTMDSHTQNTVDSSIHWSSEGQWEIDYLFSPQTRAHLLPVFLPQVHIHNTQPRANFSWIILEALNKWQGG